MSGNLLVINVDIREVRVALIENGIIAELHIERLSARSTFGNVYLGSVSRVLPGMNAAFIDIGEERAAFLHVEDLIRPDDFEAYLRGERNDDDASEDGSDGDAVADDAVADDAVADDAVADDAGDGAGPPGAVDADLGDASQSEEQGASVAEPGGDDDPEPVVAEAGEADPEIEVGDVGTPDSDPPPPEGRRRGSPTVPRVAPAPDGDDVTRAATKKTTKRKTTKKKTTKTRTTRKKKSTSTSGGSARRPRRRRSSGGRNKGDRSRIPKNTPIREVVREGQEVVVQVTKEPIGTKGARVSSHISLPGRYVVYLPTVEHVGISKRIGSDRERERLREVIDSVKPKTGGLVVRTVAEGLTKKGLKNDVGYLIRLWDEIAKKREEAVKAPSLLYEELDLILKTARDLFTEDVGRIVIDNREQFGRLKRFVEMFMPDRANDVELYEGREPLFDAYGIEDEIGRALSRKVPLQSGGHLIIDQAEALTAIDVNTGRFVGKGSKDLEDTILQANLEAVQEIAYQLRFRNIGGLIILDLIDMDRAANREKVRRKLEALLAKDKAKTTLNRISDLGLIEMTRKRTRESLGRLMNEPCFYCDGTGQLQSKETIAYEILRQIRREEMNLRGYKITVNAHPAIIDLLQHAEGEAVKEAERMFQRRINLVACDGYHLEQFDLRE